ncbi:SHOCT domain-containing protein [Aquibacillus sp. 3ASR75-11]|uniref:SHOCT domain-containing protein n=1 Tax=Terrihalobacillus insolitus TaxID=2950438 RepID=A0A9X3WNM6_9BACI|nr:SHOCT domain-containing protein [Terrihalobacillus insolitus]MDC3411972.1 SHOCT domain-containing protein [Terrihalobacillus insolitus]MDC3423342.1 SHOCT domain-containing protein [Terrihalobacillus insolitus]
MMWNNGTECLGGGFPMMMVGGIFMLVFWGLVIWLIVLAIQKLSSENKDKSNQTDKAVEILRQRYSRGEIDTEEYRQRLHELENKP